MDRKATRLDYRDTISHPLSISAVCRLDISITYELPVIQESGTADNPQNTGRHWQDAGSWLSEADSHPKRAAYHRSDHVATALASVRDRMVARGVKREVIRRGTNGLAAIG